jgi:mxaJ protein
MSSRCPRGRIRRSTLGLLLAAAAVGWGADRRVLRVCADPDNLPFSNQRAEGFENRLADLVARSLGRTVEYTWAPQRRGFVRNTLNAGECDVMMGVPSTLEMVAATRPYYRGTYVFVSRKLGIRSFDDPRLAKLRIGLQMIGDDYTPPAYALSARGLAGNVVGFNSHEPAKIVDAVKQGAIDVAVVWGALAGYYSAPDLEITPVRPSAFEGVPFTFDMSMGVRKSDQALRADLDAVIAAQCRDIQKLLEEYRVPREGNLCESQSRSSSEALR